MTVLISSLAVEGDPGPEGAAARPEGDPRGAAPAAVPDGPEAADADARAPARELPAWPPLAVHLDSGGVKYLAHAGPGYLKKPRE